MSKVKVLYVITGLACGGAEVQLSTLVRSMRNEAGIDVKVISIASASAILDRFDGVDVDIIPVNTFLGCAKLLRSVVSYKPDIIHSHMIHSNIIALLLSLFLRIKCVCTSHNTNEGGRFRFLVFSFLCWLAKPQIYHVSSQGALNYKSNLLLRNGIIKKYINPVDFSRFVRKKRTDNVCSKKWVCVASMTKQKRHDRLLNGFKHYLNTYHEDILYLIGVGPESVAISELIDKLHLTENVIMVGQKNDLHVSLQQYDYFVLSSDWEGLPVAMIEALYVGLPVVVTDCGDVSSVILNHHNGLIVDLNNADDDFANAMAQLRLATRNNYSDWSFRCQDSVSGYDVDIVKKTWIETYKDLCKYESC